MSRMVSVQRGVGVALGTQLVAESSAGSTCIDAHSLCIHLGFHDAVLLDVFGQSGTIHALHACVQQASLGQFAQQVERSACPVVFLDGVSL